MSDYKDSDGWERRSGGSFTEGAGLGNHLDQQSAGITGADTYLSGAMKVDAANRQKNSDQRNDFSPPIKISPALWRWIFIGIAIWVVVITAGYVISSLGLSSKEAFLLLIVPVFAYGGYKLFIEKRGERSGRKILSVVLNMLTMLVPIALFIWWFSESIAIWGSVGVAVVNHLLQKVIKAK